MALAGYEPDQKTMSLRGVERRLGCGQGDEGEDGGGDRLVVLGQAAIAAGRVEGSLDQPALLDDLRLDGARVAPDHLDAQRVVRRHGLVGLLRVVAAVGKHALELRNAPAHLVEQQGRDVAVLHFGGMNDKAVGRPNVSTKAWILRPLTFLPALYPTASAGSGAGWLASLLAPRPPFPPT